jgi:hypothetical protein
MSRPLILFAALTLALAACQQSAKEPAAAAPDAADTATADAQPAAADSSVSAMPLKKPSATDVPMPGTTAVPAANIGAAGYGGLRFGMSRSDAEQAIGAAFNPPAQGDCQQVHRAGQVDVSYQFEDDKLQRIDVRAPGVMAEGGGHVGMQIDDIRTLYAGHLAEQPRKDVQGGHYLRVAGANGNAIVFETDASGNVTAFRAGVATALDSTVTCA